MAIKSVTHVSGTPVTYVSGLYRVGRVVARQGTDPLPALGTARPWVLEEPKLSRYL
jgi:hypothetical protein